MNKIATPNQATGFFNPSDARFGLKQAIGLDPAEALDKLIESSGYVRGIVYRDVDPVHGSFYLVPVFTGSGPVVDCIHLTEDFGFTETFGPVPNPVHVYRIGKAVGIWKGVL